MDWSIDKWAGNIVSVGAIFGTFIGWLPGIAAFIAFVWYLIQIYESATVQLWLKRRLLKKLQRLHQQASELELQLVDTTDRETLDRLKKTIAMRVDIDVGLQKRETIHKKANEAMIAAAQEKKPPPQDGPDTQTL